MSATVENPNEIAQVKHLLSLAQSINDKIDAAISGSSQSDTSTKLPRNAYLTREYDTTAITSVSANDIGDISNPLILDIHYDDQQGHYEEISITTTSETAAFVYFYSWVGRSNDVESNIGQLIIIKAGENEAQTVQITIAEDEQYQSETITLTITAE